MTAIYYSCRFAIFAIVNNGDVEGVVSGLNVRLQALGSLGALLLLCFLGRMSSLFVCRRLHISYREALFASEKESMYSFGKEGFSSGRIFPNEDIPACNIASEGRLLEYKRS